MLAILGVKQHLGTQAAWNQRFTKEVVSEPSGAALTPAELKDQAEQEAQIAEARLRRVADQMKAMKKERESRRCIDHIPFRKIDGGWENVPGESC